jgi:hypothetical protein
VKNINLGQLQKIALREVWEVESADFTPWLAREDNLRLLGEAIGMELECQSKESRVGPFRADILCKGGDPERWVLVENQLERTDHSHLGQLLTYAGGLDAVTIVWIAERFTEEHRAALDWLNEHTDEHIHFFGLEIELWRIDDSPPAPKFNVVCKPNTWTRVISDTAKGIEAGELSGRPQLQYQYWSEFLNVLRSRKQVFENRTPQGSSSMGFPVGRTEFRLWTELYIPEPSIGVGLTFKPPNALQYFNLMKKESASLEQALGFSLAWDEKPGRALQFVGVYRNCDPADRDSWPEQHLWLAEKLERFQSVFAERVKNLVLPP